VAGSRGLRILLVTGALGLAVAGGLLALARRGPTLAPDFVVEVVSPNDTARDVEERIDTWLQFGTLVAWALYPPRTVYIYRGLDRVERRSADDELDAEPTLPGFRCRVSDLFPS